VNREDLLLEVLRGRQFCSYTVLRSALQYNAFLITRKRLLDMIDLSRSLSFHVINHGAGISTKTMSTDGLTAFSLLSLFGKLKGGL
jgi:hypothetical protein